MGGGWLGRQQVIHLRKWLHAVLNSPRVLYLHTSVLLLMYISDCTILAGYEADTGVMARTEELAKEFGTKVGDNYRG